MKKSIKVLLGLAVVVFTVCTVFSTFLPTIFAAETVTNAQMLNMCNNADNYIDANGKVPQIIYTDTGHTNSVSAAEFYYMMARWLRWYKNNNTPPATVSIIRGTTGPSSPSGVETGTIQKADLLVKGKTNADFIDANGQLPNYSTVGSTNYTTKAMFWVFARTIQWYRDNGAMPNYATVRAVNSPASWTGGPTPTSGPTPTPGAHTNPLSGIVGYGQINTSTVSGSCGSHSGAVAIEYLSGRRNDVAWARAAEQSIYTYSGMNSGPGDSTCRAAYNWYMNNHGIPYTAVAISKSQVPTYISQGRPVVAHVPNHYVTIYGIVGNTCYYSDGSHGYGTSGSWEVGAGGYLRAISWSSFPGQAYNGFNHK